MPNVEQNLSLWAEYDWKHRGEEWSSAWGGSQFQWQWSILPRIHAFIPARSILEIGSGFGRWTQYLKNNCQQFVGVDLSENCVQFCKERFSGDSRLKFHINDGESLAMIADRSVDFVFSFDSLVHAEADVLEAYLTQLAKKLSPDGVGFVHHSNLGAYRYYYSMKRLIPGGKGFLWKVGLLDNDGLRANDVTATLFESYAVRAGLQCISQEIVNWASKRLIDCFSVFTPVSSKWARPNVVLKNPGFMKEAECVRRLSSLYCSREK